MDIKNITSPEFLKDYDNKQLKQLAGDIREYLLDCLSKNGGHLSSNLGVVELTIALHKVFDSPNDKILFDVGHQSYTHKILTGRAKGLYEDFRQVGGISGYQRPNESPHDPMSAGHSSTALSIAEGLAVARDLNGEDHHIIAVIGDGAIASGLAFEALNQLSALKSKVIVILNDNEMSITKPVGGLGKMMARFRNSAGYNKSKKAISKSLGRIPGVGLFLKRGKNAMKSLFLESNVFEQMDIRYVGVIDGHDFDHIIKALKIAKNSKSSILLHMSTQKGHGYHYAANDSSGFWHGVNPFDKQTGKEVNQKPLNYLSWSQVMSNLMLEQGKIEPDLVFITPAMLSGSKMEVLKDTFPQRFYDVGIAEEHAITFASGLALGKKIPYLSIYSTFMQRAYDNLNHDIARMNLPCIISVDRAGLVGEDGETHHGYYDVEICKGLPNNFIAMPLDYNDAKNIVNLAVKSKKLAFIRVPRGGVDASSSLSLPPFNGFKWSSLHRGNGKNIVISTGPITTKVLKMIETKHPEFDLIFARFYHPLDVEMLKSLAPRAKNIIIYDIYATKNGLYEDICTYLYEIGHFPKIHPLTLPNEVIGHGKIEDLLALLSLSLEDLEKKMRSIR